MSSITNNPFLENHSFTFLERDSSEKDFADKIKDCENTLTLLNLELEKNENEYKELLKLNNSSEKKQQIQENLETLRSLEDSIANFEKLIQQLKGFVIVRSNSTK